MNPYQKLLSNTALFGLSTFGARLLTFLLTPFYTRVLTSAEYGVTDLLIQTGNLIIPIACVGISNGVIRFGLERNSDKDSVLTVGLLTVLTGSLILLLASPLLGRAGGMSGYVWLVLLYVLAANLHSVCNQFARAMGHVRLFAVDGILRSALTVTFNILLLAVFPLGVTGYVLANVLADGLAAAFVFLCAHQWRYLRLTSRTGETASQMLRYSAPLVPNTVCGWIINISDRYLIALLIGSAATGLYAVANKIPTVLLIVANIFTSAWQLSALAERPREEKERFFSNVYCVYSAVSFAVASLAIMTARLSTRMLAAPEYFEAWHYVPVLTLATTFACLGSFMASVYMVEKRSTAILVTTLLGAAANLVGNGLLIPRWGAMGAAVSTLVSYVLIFLIRACHTRTMVRIRLRGWKLGLQSGLLLAQCIVIEADMWLWPLWSTLCLLGILWLDREGLCRAWRSAVVRRNR